MFTRVFGPCLLFLSVLIVGFPTVMAQVPLDLPGGVSTHRSAVGNPITPEAAGWDGSPSISLCCAGDAGLELSICENLWRNRRPYPGDANHLNYPWGITTVGNSLWVTKSWGLLFDANLTHIATLGEPGVPGDDNTHLRDP